MNADCRFGKGLGHSDWADVVSNIVIELSKIEVLELINDYMLVCDLNKVVCCAFNRLAVDFCAGYNVLWRWWCMASGKRRDITEGSRLKYPYTRR